MKVLEVSIPGSGHLRPLLPLTEALVEQGDEVVVACGFDPGGAIARTGARHAPVGRTEVEWFETLGTRVRGNPGDGLPPERIGHYFIPRLFGEIGAPDMIDGVLEIGREFEPDLIVFETYAFAAPLAAAVLGVPAVHHNIGPMLADDVLELANDALSPLWRSFGRDIPGYGGVYEGITIELAPPSLDTGRTPRGEPIGLQCAPLPERDPSPSTPPLVYVTLGTMFGNPDVFGAVLEGLATAPVEVLVTVGEDLDPQVLSPLPANARVERFVPQAELLPDASVVVHHGGAGTMFGSLAHGLPQVVLPQGADNFDNGALLTQAGAGRTLLPHEVSADAVGDAVRTLLDDASHAAAARRIAAEIAAMPTPEAVARLLRARVGRGPV